MCDSSVFSIGSKTQLGIQDSQSKERVLRVDTFRIVDSHCVDVDMFPIDAIHMVGS